MSLHLELEEQLQIMELENKALRVQNERQCQIINELREDNELLRRYRKLVKRASELAEDLPKLKEELIVRTQL